MTLNIANYDGSLFTIIPDQTLNHTSSSLGLPGRGLQEYGTAINQDLLWIMQNFSNNVAPTAPVNGQTWFDTTVGLLKVFDITIPAWKVIASGIYSELPPGPLSPNQGDLWWDITNQQLNAWNASVWVLIGPTSTSQFWSSNTNNAPANNNTFALGNVTNRISTVYMVDGDAAGNMNVDGVMFVNTAIVTTGPAVVEGALYVDGDIAASSGLGVNGNVQVGGEINVEGLITIGGSAYIEDSLNVIGQATIDGTANVNNVRICNSGMGIIFPDNTFQTTAYSPNYTTGSTGYTFLPGGILLQWASGVVAAPNGGPDGTFPNQAQSITFAIPFPNAIFQTTVSTNLTTATYSGDYVWQLQPGGTNDYVDVILQLFGTGTSGSTTWPTVIAIGN